MRLKITRLNYTSEPSMGLLFYTYSTRRNGGTCNGLIISMQTLSPNADEREKGDSMRDNRGKTR